MEFLMSKLAIYCLVFYSLCISAQQRFDTNDQLVKDMAVSDTYFSAKTNGIPAFNITETRRLLGKISDEPTSYPASCRNNATCENIPAIHSICYGLRLPYLSTALGMTSDANSFDEVQECAEEEEGSWLPSLKSALCELTKAQPYSGTNLPSKYTGQPYCNKEDVRRYPYMFYLSRQVLRSSDNCLGSFCMFGLFRQMGLPNRKLSPLPRTYLVPTHANQLLKRIVEIIDRIPEVREEPATTLPT